MGEAAAERLTTCAAWQHCSPRAAKLRHRTGLLCPTLSLPLIYHPCYSPATPTLACLRPPCCSAQPLRGFTNAQPTWGALDDCWQQLAVVKNGPELTFFRNGEAAGGFRVQPPQRLWRKLFKGKSERFWLF